MSFLPELRGSQGKFWRKPNTKPVELSETKKSCRRKCHAVLSDFRRKYEAQDASNGAARYFRFTQRCYGILKRALLMIRLHRRGHRSVMALG